MRIFRTRTLLAACAASLTVMGVSLLGVGVGVAGAATVVSCPTANLQTAINAAAPGTTLVVHGTCTGNFTIDEKTRT